VGHQIRTIGAASWSEENAQKLIIVQRHLFRPTFNCPLGDRQRCKLLLEFVAITSFRIKARHKCLEKNQCYKAQIRSMVRHNEQLLVGFRLRISLNCSLPLSFESELSLQRYSRLLWGGAILKEWNSSRLDEELTRTKWNMQLGITRNYLFNVSCANFLFSEFWRSQISGGCV
jgi:hypothetical protein